MILFLLSVIQRLTAPLFQFVTFVPGVSERQGQFRAAEPIAFCLFALFGRACLLYAFSHQISLAIEDTQDEARGLVNCNILNFAKNCSEFRLSTIKHIFHSLCVMNMYVSLIYHS